MSDPGNFYALEDLRMLFGYQITPVMATEEIRQMNLRRSSADEISRVAEREGMVRLRDDGLLKGAQGITTIEEALRTL